MQLFEPVADADEDEAGAQNDTFCDENVFPANSELALDATVSPGQTPD